MTVQEVVYNAIQYEVVSRMGEEFADNETKEAIVKKCEKFFAGQLKKVRFNDTQKEVIRECLDYEGFGEDLGNEAIAYMVELKVFVI